MTATIDAGDEPDSIAVDTVTHAVYVGNRTANTVTVLTPGPGLWFTQPTDITADATSPSGATVTFPLPTATDSDGASPTVACHPHSGAIFPIGTTTVCCSVSDPNVANGPITHPDVGGPIAHNRGGPDCRGARLLEGIRDCRVSTCGVRAASFPRRVEMLDGRVVLDSAARDGWR